MYRSNILGFIVMILGLVLFLVAVGDLLIKIIVALVALAMVNYGMRMRGMAPMQYYARTFIFRRMM